MADATNSSSVAAETQTSELRSTLATITECPVCCESFSVSERKPKLMTPCGHTLCLDCGVAYCRHKAVSSSGGRIACPVCRHGVRLPAGGFAALPNNLTMMKLLDIRDILIRSDSEAELKSAFDMIDGLIGCENRLQRAADELDFIKDDIESILRRRRRSSSVGETVTTSATVSPSSSSKTGTTAATAAAGFRRSSTFFMTAGKSASAGNVTSANMSSQTAPGITSVNGVAEGPKQTHRRHPFNYTGGALERQRQQQMRQTNSSRRIQGSQLGRPTGGNNVTLSAALADRCDEITCRLRELFITSPAMPLPGTTTSEAALITPIPSSSTTAQFTSTTYDLISEVFDVAQWMPLMTTTWDWVGQRLQDLKITGSCFLKKRSPMETAVLGFLCVVCVGLAAVGLAYVSNSRR